MTGTEELLIRAASGDRWAESRLLEQNGGLIRAVACRFSGKSRGRGIDEDDLFQLASIGFIKAVRNFDVASGYALSTYAVPKMMGEIRRFLRDDGLIRVGRTVKERAARLAAVREKLACELGREPTVSELGEELGLEAEEICEAAEAVGAMDGNLSALAGEDEKSSPAYVGTEGEEEKIVERLALGSSMELLDQKARAILDLRYRRGLTQAKTAVILGMTQVQVSRTEKKAVETLRKILSGE
ncbi:MAG: sigma-70 family RNA polymerase sigma factor [Clostridia bacterium]|nr:sigma-70 family RNA polymerase sigma factor [Clostridia bacterium]